jgi:hypothetical protein
MSEYKGHTVIAVPITSTPALASILFGDDRIIVRVPDADGRRQVWREFSPHEFGDLLCRLANEAPGNG